MILNPKVTVNESFAVLNFTTNFTRSHPHHCVTVKMLVSVTNLLLLAVTAAILLGTLFFHNGEHILRFLSDLFFPQPQRTDNLTLMM